jgi:tyrosyl-tRNA synthetase
LQKTDGTKFGKTAGGSVWLDPEMTSPYAFYQYWLGTDDADVERFLKTSPFKSREELEELFVELKNNPGVRVAHRALARELTTLVHGESECEEQAEAAAEALFGQGGEISRSQSEDTCIGAFTTSSDARPSLVVMHFQHGLIFLQATGVVDSKSAARRIVKEGGACLRTIKGFSGRTLPLQEVGPDFMADSYCSERAKGAEPPARWFSIRSN